MIAMTSSASETEILENIQEQKGSAQAPRIAFGVASPEV
jgi:hypothetical protein